MLASEVINVYEAFCPQEFSMEGDSRGLQIGTLDKKGPKRTSLADSFICPAFTTKIS